MTFKELLYKKNTSGYALSKKTGIPYTTISDLINCKTNFNNVSLKNALMIAEALKVDVKKLASLEADKPVEFRYFRNNILNELKRSGDKKFITKVIKSKSIDYYHKNNEKDKALYLLCLIDYLAKKNGSDIYAARYNDYRKERLSEIVFAGSNLFNYKSVEEAEKDLGIKAIPEFKKYNILEDNIYNVA